MLSANVKTDTKTDCHAIFPLGGIVVGAVTSTKGNGTGMRHGNALCRCGMIGIQIYGTCPAILVTKSRRTTSVIHHYGLLIGRKLHTEISKKHAVRKRTLSARIED